jgi:hypothetical protein
MLLVVTLDRVRCCCLFCHRFSVGLCAACVVLPSLLFNIPTSSCHVGDRQSCNDADAVCLSPSLPGHHACSHLSLLLLLSLIGQSLIGQCVATAPLPEPMGTVPSTFQCVPSTIIDWLLWIPPYKGGSFTRLEYSSLLFSSLPALE